MPENFIDAYIQHTIGYESPLSFWKWSAYATISAVLKDKCYIKNGDSFLFPNLYTLIVAESSGHRKNRPIEFSETLVNAVQGNKTISGRATAHAILDELARAETDAKTGKVIKNSSAIFYAPELSAGIVGDPEGLKILTDIYDYKTNPYKSRLRTGPCFNLDKIVFSMLTASNEDMLRSLFDTSVIKGGFLARQLLVVPNEFRQSNSLLRVDHTKLKESKANVVELLRQVSLEAGEFQLEEDAIKEYEDWYNPFRQSYSQKKEASGIVGRIHTHILKISIVLAANEHLHCIKRRHIEQAINDCLGLLPNYSIFTMAHGKSELSQLGGIVINELLEAPNHTKSKKELIRAHWPAGLDPETLDKLVVTLDMAGMITQYDARDNEGMRIMLTPKALEMLGRKECKPGS